jgi:hypothetical protein
MHRNLDGVRYLYAPNDIMTAILEVRLGPTQYVSAAEIEVPEDISV